MCLKEDNEAIGSIGLIPPAQTHTAVKDDEIEVGYWLECQKKCGFTYHHTEENKPCALMGDVRTEHFTYLAKNDWMEFQSRKSRL